VTTAAELLPEGLPDWFYRSDKDGDGQISMAEFSSRWDSDTVRRFSQYDTNSDGFITPKECLSAGPSASSSSSSSSSSRR
jgi:Ca2+-binding EF-hand superfamily protein